MEASAVASFSTAHNQLFVQSQFDPLQQFCMHLPVPIRFIAEATCSLNYD